MAGWIGVDLDGTLAYYDHWRGDDHIGDPIPMMADRVRDWVDHGVDVRILTARVSHFGRSLLQREKNIDTIQNWMQKHFGFCLTVTAEKDFCMVELWDDRCKQVIPNTGRAVEVEKDSAYRQRNALAIAFAQLAISAGHKAGWYTDLDHPDWEDGWRTVVLIQVGSTQVSWRMAPTEQVMAMKLLPHIEPCWDGTFLGSDPGWPYKMYRALVDPSISTVPVAEGVDNDWEPQGGA